MFKRIRWRIAVPYTVLILIAMGALSIYLSRVTRDAALDDLRSNLRTEARAVVENVRSALTGDELDAGLDDLADRWAMLLDARVTIISAEGTVLGESHADVQNMPGHLRRPEIQQALVTGEGSSMRHSETLGMQMMYAALPVEAGGEVVGFVRVALPLDSVEQQISSLRNSIYTAALITTLSAILLAIVIADRTARPVRRLTGVARRMAQGDLDARLYTSSRDEVGELTRAFNHMGEQLREKVNTLADERERLATILELMADGVLITGAHGQVQLINPAACELLNTTREEALGQTFAEVVRHHQLIEVWQRCQETAEEQVQAVEMAQRELFVQLIVTPLHESRPGSLVILQNLTPIRRLQTVRRDFISNISHELRTPLASLKALVETLRDSALEDPPAAERFLDRAEQEVDALSQMVQELLELSRIESGKVPLRLSPIPVSDVVLSAVERLRPQAGRSQLELIVDLPGGLPPVLADAERVRQVLINLVHNAIKFTPAGGSITVQAEFDTQEQMVVVSVVDTGVGIPAPELSRIFERFYKADRARRSGGTGLGLAIARHLVQAHGGQIWATNNEDRGTTFSFTLPVAEDAAGTPR